MLPHYRRGFFAAVAEALAAANCDFELHYGQERPGTVPRSIRLDAPWAHRHANRYLGRGRAEFVWQPALRAAAGADLVIVEHAGRLLLNPVLLALQALGGPAVVFWGHGQNLQHGGRSRERLKSFALRHARGFFAYTALSVQLARESGVPSPAIVCINNTIDASELSRALAALDADALASVRRRIGLVGDEVAVFCGRLDPSKRIPFLLEACSAIRRLRPAFELLIVGDGPERPRVEAFAAHNPWCHVVGEVIGGDRAPYFALSRVVLMPGMVGLVLIDSFAARVPLVTTSAPIHSPEIAYLRSGRNGLMVADDVAAYAGAVAALLGDQARLDELRDGGAEAAAELSLDAMVANFVGGALRFLPAAAGAK